MKQVKGSIFKLIVKPIKANKSGNYDTLLSDKAKELLKQTILDTTWYPYELYRECYKALMKVEANNDPVVLHQWGQQYGELLFTSIYKSKLGHGRIDEAIQGYQRFHDLAYNFGESVAEFVSDNEVIITFKGFDREWENFYHVALGWVHKFVELSIKKEITSKFISKSWEGADATKISLSWPS